MKQHNNNNNNKNETKSDEYDKKNKRWTDITEGKDTAKEKERWNAGRRTEGEGGGGRGSGRVTIDVGQLRYAVRASTFHVTCTYFVHFDDVSFRSELFTRKVQTLVGS